MCSGNKAHQQSEVIAPKQVVVLPKFAPRLNMMANKLYNKRMEAKRAREEEAKSLENMSKELDQTEELEHRSSGFEQELHRTISNDMNFGNSSIHWF